MSIDLRTNINAGKVFGNPEVNNANSLELSAIPIRHNRGITNISDVEGNKMFSPTAKPTLSKPEITVEELAVKTLDLTFHPEISKNLNIGSQPTLSEFMSAYVNKVKNNIGQLTGDEKVKQSDALDSETLNCLLQLFTLGSKSKLIETLKTTLNAKVNARAAENQSYIDKNVDVQKARAEKQQEQAKVQASQKRWGIVGASISIIAAIASTVLTVATFGAAAPLAILAYAACAATVVGCTCTIGSLVTGNETLSKVGKWFGIAGAVLSLVGGIGNYFGKAIEKAPDVLQFASVIAGCASGVTSGGSQIINGLNQKDLAKLEKELAETKIGLEKLDQEISLLSDFIQRVSDYIRQFMKDIFQNEEKAAEMLRQMFNAAFGIGQNIKC